MRLFLIAICSISSVTQSAEYKYHDFPNHPMPPINFVLLPPYNGAQENYPRSYADALHQGSLQGTEGGMSILVKSLIVTIPTACYLLWTVIQNWYNKHDVTSLKKKHLQEQTQLLIARTHYMQALADFLKVRESTEADLAHYQVAKKKDSKQN